MRAHVRVCVCFVCALARLNNNWLESFKVLLQADLMSLSGRKAFLSSDFPSRRYSLTSPNLRESARANLTFTADTGCAWKRSITGSLKSWTRKRKREKERRGDEIESGSDIWNDYTIAGWQSNRVPGSESTDNSTVMHAVHCSRDAHGRFGVKQKEKSRMCGSRKIAGRIVDRPSNRLSEADGATWTREKYITRGKL